MIDLPHQPLSGYLLAWDSRRDATSPDWTELPATKIIPYALGRQWVILEHKSTEKWIEDSFNREDESFTYRFLLSRSSAAKHAVLIGSLLSGRQY
jgi:hypothetical protein